MLRTNVYLVSAFLSCFLIHPAILQAQQGKPSAAGEQTTATQDLLDNEQFSADDSLFKGGDAQKEFPNVQVDAQKDFPNLQVDAQQEFPGTQVDAQKEFPNLQVDTKKEFLNS